LGGIQSPTFTVRAAPASAGPIAPFPSTVSAVSARGTPTGPGGAGFHVPAGDMHVVQRVQDAQDVQGGLSNRHPQVHGVPRAITGLQTAQRSFAGYRDGVDSSSMSAMGSQLSPPPRSRNTIQPMIPGVMSSATIAHHGSHGAQRSFTEARGARDISPISAMGSQVAPPPISSIAIPPMVSGLSLSPNIPQLVGHGAQHAHGAGFQTAIPDTAASGGGQNGSRALSHNGSDTTEGSSALQYCNRKCKGQNLALPGRKACRQCLDYDKAKYLKVKERKIATAAASHDNRPSAPTPNGTQRDGDALPSMRQLPAGFTPALNDAETANATAAENESQVRRMSTPDHMRIFEELLGLCGRGVVRIPTDGELMNNPRVRQFQQRAPHIPPAVLYQLLRITCEWHNAQAGTQSAEK
jgi:hypothetical protein